MSSADASFFAATATALCWRLFAGESFCCSVTAFFVGRALSLLSSIIFNEAFAEWCRSAIVFYRLIPAVALWPFIKTDLKLAFADPGSFKFGDQLGIHTFRQVN